MKESLTHNVDIFTQSEPLYQEYLANGVAVKCQVDASALCQLSTRISG